jgi:hypothetical protein
MFPQLLAGTFFFINSELNPNKSLAWIINDWKDSITQGN